MPAITSALEDETLLDLYDYWRGKWPSKTLLPARRHIDPVDIPRLLANLVLIDHIGRGDFRIRLAGTNVVRGWGRDITGRRLEEMMSGSYLDYILGLCQECVDRRAALYSSSMFRWDQKTWRRAKRLMLPLANDGQSVDMILLGHVLVGNAQGNWDGDLNRRDHELIPEGVFSNPG